MQIATKITRGVAVGIDRRAGLFVVARFHDVVEIAGVIIATDMEEGELARPAGDGGLETADALEFAEVGAVVVEPAALDHLNDAEDSGDTSGQPDIPVCGTIAAPERS